MDERLTSGDEGLDLILDGGLPMNGINLIIGLPGSGKTMLCQQLMFAGASAERPAVYLSTVSEPFEKIVRYAQTFSFFDREAIGRSVHYEDLGRVVAGEGGLTAVNEQIAATIKERRPGSSRSTASRRWPRSPTMRATSAASCMVWARCSRPFPRPASGLANTGRRRRARLRSSPWPTGSSRWRPSV